MFLKYRIMRKLEFGEFVSIEEYRSWFPNTNSDKVDNAVDILGNLGFIVHNEDCTGISLRTFSSLHNFLFYQRKVFFDYAVGISAIVIAIEALINIWQALFL